MGSRSSSFRKSTGGGLALGGLPTLEGSEKQVKWAEEIRDQYKDQFNFFKDHYLDKGYDYREDFEKKYGRQFSQRHDRSFLRDPEVRAKVAANNELKEKQNVSVHMVSYLAERKYGNVKNPDLMPASARNTTEYRDYLAKGARDTFKNEKNASWWIDHRQSKN